MERKTFHNFINICQVNHLYYMNIYVCTNKPYITEVFKISQDWCYAAARHRLRLLKDIKWTECARRIHSFKTCMNLKEESIVFKNPYLTCLYDADTSWVINNRIEYLMTIHVCPSWSFKMECSSCLFGNPLLILLC